MQIFFIIFMFICMRYVKTFINASEFSLIYVFSNFSFFDICMLWFCFRLNRIAMQWRRIRCLFIWMQNFDDFVFSNFFAFSIFCFSIRSSFLRYLQSEFTSLEKLNRVRNIFRNRCLILLNCETVMKYWANRKVDDREVFNSKTWTKFSYHVFFRIF